MNVDQATNRPWSHCRDFIFNSFHPPACDEFRTLFLFTFKTPNQLIEPGRRLDTPSWELAIMTGSISHIAKWLIITTLVTGSRASDDGDDFSNNLFSDLAP
jgi:hypothetical protein